MNRIEQLHQIIFEAQEKTVRMENEEFTEEQIQARCAELRNYTIDQESMNHFRNPKLKAIWESGPRFRKL